MTVTAPVRRPSATVRRVGYVVAAAVNAVVFYLVNIRPGWQAVPFLTADTARVLGLVNLSLGAGVLANLGYLFADPPWLRALGGLLTTAISIAALAWLWRVFPLDFADAAVDWALWARVVLVVALVGSVISLVVQIVALARTAVGQGRAR